MSEKTHVPLPEDGRTRVEVSRLWPELDGGRTPVRRVRGERLTVAANCVADGHDEVRAVLRYRPPAADGAPAAWLETPMRALGSDRFEGGFDIAVLGTYMYTVEAWIDRYATWRRDLERWAAAGEPLDGVCAEGALLVGAAAGAAQAGGAVADAASLRRLAEVVATAGDTAVQAARDDLAAALVERHLPRPHAGRYPGVLAVRVERERAGVGAWYEMFPRSAGPVPGVHGRLDRLEARLDYVAGMGFDVLYLPPVHPIGLTARKGRNNARTAGPGDVGSPWAVGAAEGGHTAVHPDLGGIAALRRLLVAARERGLEVALDVALQCAPDHPWVREHPEWFRHRPDGSIRYAENPPKRYQDIYPLDFECDAWESLWRAVRQVFAFWLDEGVRLFRVDNPHTKPVGFWRWLIADVQASCPDAVFLAEAFTRPALMYGLAKAGFSQSYTYFAWRTDRKELTDYVTELFHTEVREFFRPALWPNTPDILAANLQRGGRAAFAARFLLAATLGTAYGIYGPAFELGFDRSLGPGSEEYLHSEKYELRWWDVDDPGSLRPLITRVNAIRHDEAAFGVGSEVTVLPCDNPQLFAYARHAQGGAGAPCAIVVNLDPQAVQSGSVDVAPALVGVPAGAAVRACDLLSGEAYPWQAGANYVSLDPARAPAHILRLEPSAHAVPGGAP